MDEKYLFEVGLGSHSLDLPDIKTTPFDAGNVMGKMSFNVGHVTGMAAFDIENVKLNISERGSMTRVKKEVIKKGKIGLLGKPDPKNRSNYVVSDGNGGMKPWIHPFYKKNYVLQAGAEFHENFHIEELKKYATNLDILNDPTRAGEVVGWSGDVKEFEVRAYRAEMDFYKNALGSIPKTEKNGIKMLNTALGAAKSNIKDYE